MKKYLTTAQFAKICSTTKHTLYYYDEIDILKPLYVNDKGYRFYGLQQYELFQIISILKESDLPLQKIKEYLNKRSPENFISLLNKIEEDINTKIKKLKSSQSIMKIFKEEVQKAIINLNKINIEEVQATYLYFKEINENDPKILLKKFIELDKEIVEKNISVLFPGYTNTISSTQNNKLTNFSLEGFFFVSRKKTSECILRKKGKYFTIYNDKGFENQKEILNLVLKIAKENNINIENSYHVEFICDGFSKKNITEYITKFYFKIIE